MTASISKLLHSWPGGLLTFLNIIIQHWHQSSTIFFNRSSTMLNNVFKVYKLITLGTKVKNLLSLGGKITMFSKFITNYIEQGWWHSSLSLKCMHLQLKEVNKRGRHAYNLHGWTCLASGIVMEIHCHITGNCEAPMSSSLFSVICSWFSKVLLFRSLPQ